MNLALLFFILALWSSTRFWTRNRQSGFISTFCEAILGHLSRCGDFSSIIVSSLWYFSPGTDSAYARATPIYQDIIL